MRGPCVNKDDESESTVTGKNPRREEVDGVRRIWGTVRGCTTHTILMVLQKFSTVAEKVKVCRKFKKGRNNTIKWWFLIRGEEGVLQVLQQEWERIQTQTSWRLEHCYRPAQRNDEQQLIDVSSLLEKK